MGHIFPFWWQHSGIRSLNKVSSDLLLVHSSDWSKDNHK